MVLRCSEGSLGSGPSVQCKKATQEAIGIQQAQKVLSSLVSSGISGFQEGAVCLPRLWLAGNFLLNFCWPILLPCGSDPVLSIQHHCGSSGRSKRTSLKGGGACPSVTYETIDWYSEVNDMTHHIDEYKYMRMKYSTLIKMRYYWKMICASFFQQMKGWGTIVINIILNLSVKLTRGYPDHLSPTERKTEVYLIRVPLGPLVNIYCNHTIVCIFLFYLIHLQTYKQQYSKLDRSILKQAWIFTWHLRTLQMWTFTLLDYIIYYIYTQ